MATPTFEDIEKKLDNFLLLSDRGILRLLLAFLIARKLPTPPTFLFIVGASSGAKTVLIQLLAKVSGYTEMGNMTANTFLSGAKRSDKETSFLLTLIPSSFLIWKDWTSILSQYKELMGVIVAQLREIYDQSFNKRTGLGDNIQWRGKVSLLAGVTSEMYIVGPQMASMGERVSLYHLTQPDPIELGRWLMKPEHRKRDEIKLADELQDMIRDFEKSIIVSDDPAKLPDFDPEVEEDLVQLAFFATGARSSIAREQYNRDKRINMAHDREQIGRFLKQIRVIAYGLAHLNPDRQLLPIDKTILYRIALDSIPIQRKKVLEALTENKLGGTLPQLSDYLHLPHDTVKIYIDDLVALGLVRNHAVYHKGSTIRTYTIDPQYGNIMGRFAGIDQKLKSLPDSEEERAAQSAEEPPPMPDRETFI